MDDYFNDPETGWNEEADHLAAAIGHVVLSFNAMEEALGHLLASLLKCRDADTGRRFVRQLHAAGRIDMLKMLAAEPPRDMPAAVSDALTRVTTTATILRNRRNRIIHAVLVRDSDGHASGLVDPDNHSGRHEDLSPDTLLGVAEAMDALGREALELSTTADP